MKLWNDLDSNAKQIPTYNQFKYHLSHIDTPGKSPDYFHVGDRKSNILITRLRHSCSILKADLFKVNLVSTQNCSCGHPIEDSYHFLLQCPNYRAQRNILFAKLINYHPLTKDKLLYGDVNLAESENRQIFTSVQKFLLSSKRF